MFTRPHSNYSFWLLNIAAYVTLLTIAVAALVSIEAGPQRLLAAAGFIAFGALLAFFLRLENRPRLVHLYLALQTLIVTGIIVLEPGVSAQTQTLFFVLAAQSMLFLPVRAALLWVVVFTVVTIGGYAYFFDLRENLGILAVIGGYLFFATFGAALRQANEARQQSQRLLGELQAANAQLRAYSRQAEQLAVAEERNRLAREMHDALGHRLTVAVVQLEGARRLIPEDPQRAAGIVDTMRGQLKQALAELRHAVSTLRESRPADEPPARLPETLSGLVHTFSEATGLPVHLTVSPDLPPLPPATRQALFRAAQETLTNVQRHANATQAWLTVAVADEQVRLTTEDDGAGFPAERADGRFGLQGLEERASQLGGSLTLGESTHGGALVSFVVPLTAAPAPAAEAPGA